jgi:type I restriction enzyme S subunit
MPPALEYEKMKNSGIEWIGEVPSHWNIRTLYQLVSQVKNKNSDLAEQNLLSLSYGKIKRKDINSTDGLLPASFDGYNVIEAGDIVLRLTDLQNDHTSLRVGLATERGIITSAYVTLHPSDIAHSKYLYYLLHAFDIKKGFYGMGSGVRQGLNYGEVKELRFTTPSPSEVECIVSFLDAHCTSIEETISETKISIDEYRKWKESIIYETVTSGLDTDDATKETTIEWIDSLPYNWKVDILKHVTTSRDGGAWGEEPANNNNDCICMRIADFDFEKGRFKETDISQLTIRNYKQGQLDKLMLKTGDILVEKSGGGEKTPVGRTVLFDKPFPALFANFMDRLIVDDSIMYPEYFEYWWRSMYYKAVTTMYIKQTIGIQNLNLNQLLSIEKIAYPSKEIQSVIVTHLDEICKMIDTIVADKCALIEELEAYKQSLIYEVVTGKRKVV